LSSIWLGVDRWRLVLLLVDCMLLQSVLVFVKVPVTWVLHVLLRWLDVVSQLLLLDMLLDYLPGRGLILILDVLESSCSGCRLRLGVYSANSARPRIERCWHPGPCHETRRGEPGLLEWGAGWEPGGRPLRYDLLGCGLWKLLLRDGRAGNWRHRDICLMLGGG
jgi:hypothetical protein